MATRMITEPSSPRAQNVSLLSVTPPISVVMPVHNGERFLEAAISSILGQTFKDFEFVIVDDGSSDRTPAILAEAQRRDERVRVHRLDRNQGITGALNEGCRHARGRLIARMDADDVSMPTRLATQLDFMRTHPDVAVVGSWVQIIDDRSVPGEVKQFPSEPGLIAWSMVFFNSVAHPTVMMRREALDMAAVYSSEYPRAEDYALFTRLSRSLPLANIPEVLVRYRAWPGNSSKNPDQERQAVRIVRDHAHALGIDVTESQAQALQGLARDRYPIKTNDVKSLARLVDELRQAISNRAVSKPDVALINRDAAVRFWMLAALAARSAPLLSVTLGGRAFQTSPVALLTFMRKIVRHYRGSGPEIETRRPLG